MSPPLLAIPARHTTVQKQTPSLYSLQDLIEAIRCLQGPDAAESICLPVPEALFLEFEQHWAEYGDIKIRRTQQLTVVMPTPLHQCMLPFLYEAMLTIRAKLGEARTCAPVSVEITGSPSCDVNRLDGGRFMQPDAGFHVKYEGEGPLQLAHPTVVVEVACGQKCFDGREKCWTWLWRTGLKVQAVVLYDMPYPVPAKGTFLSRISIWVRDAVDAGEETGLSERRRPAGERYPLHTCRVQPEDLAARRALGAQTGGGPRELESAKVGPHEEFWRPNESQLSIRTRGGWITVVDESSQDEWAGASPELKTFDFARMCPRVLVSWGVPDDIPIPISLEVLRTSTIDLVEVERARKGGSTRTPTPTSSTGTAVSSWSELETMIKGAK
ncbi:hypothetical protein FRC10_007858 [Ceratobasidium sp. 414]|nr:hypothetical protein FRC10_007858 [Ceratobasidium sp. 414]